MAASATIPTITPAATPALLLECGVDVGFVVVEPEVGDAEAVTAIVRTTVEPPTVTVTAAMEVGDGSAVVAIDVTTTDASADATVGTSEEASPDAMMMLEELDAELVPTLLVIPDRRIVHALEPPPKDELVRRT